jgi:hypothetical protein
MLSKDRLGTFDRSHVIHTSDSLDRVNWTTRFEFASVRGAPDAVPLNANVVVAAFVAHERLADAEGAPPPVDTDAAYEPGTAPASD